MRRASGHRSPLQRIEQTEATQHSAAMRVQRAYRSIKQVSELQLLHNTHVFVPAALVCRTI